MGKNRTDYTTGRYASIRLGAHITPREIEVINLRLAGKRYKEIAVLLNIETKTAETHASNVRIKLGLTDSTFSLVEWARHNENILNAGGKDVRGFRSRRDETREAAPKV